MRNMTTEIELDDAGETGESEEQRLSKSARKREAASLQELGVQLAALPDQEIKALGLPDTLFVALRDLRRLPSLDRTRINQLADVLIDCVEGGASVHSRAARSSKLLFGRPIGRSLSLEERFCDQ